MRGWLRAVALMVIFLGSMGIWAAQASAQALKYGQEPLQDVLRWATESTVRECLKRQDGGCLSANEFAAIMLAITWPEAADAQAGAPPSPMTLSRWDVGDRNKNLYGPSREHFPRVYWHPGVGPWQIDSAGVGKYMDIEASIDSRFAAKQIADYLASLWQGQNQSLPDKTKRQRVWFEWYACTTGRCEQLFNQIYDSRTGELTVTRDRSVGRMGGAERGTCSFKGPDPRRPFNGVGELPRTWDCLLVNPQKAQGATANWQLPPPTGNFPSGPSPLAVPFYAWSMAGEEYAVFPKSLSGYPMTIAGIRPLGQDVRTSVQWQSWDQTDICFNGVCP